MGQYFLDVQTESVRKFLPASSQGRILDIGGGHAQLAKPLSEAGYNVTIVASDGACVPRLDRILGQDNYGFVQGNLLELPIESNGFDFVLVFRLLAHLDNWQQFLGEACRVAKHAVILDYPDLRSVNWFSNRMFAVKQKIEKTARAFRCFRRQEILLELSRHGYQLADYRPQFLFPMALHRLIRSAGMSRTLERWMELAGFTRRFGSPVILKAIPQA